MPSRTTRSASKRKPSRRITTSETGDNSVRDTSSPSATPKRPKLGNSKSPDDCDSQTQKSALIQPGRVVGSKLSGVKHSGLLAKDQETRWVQKVLCSQLKM